jgi:diguanylate cyclase (GGDEF)-like protein
VENKNEEAREDSFPEIERSKILIADDEKNLIELVKDTLEMAGYTVVTAYDGKQALEKIYTESPDIVILDVNMPYLTGFDVCKKIREDILMRNLPIIMLTVKSGEADEVTGLELGVDDYLTKPFNRAILLARVKSALSRAQQGISVNPLTYLPGNTSLVKEIEKRLRDRDKFAVMYLDIDRFKPYNDYYGFHRGDEIIKLLARIILTSVKQNDPPTGFVGHIGGDDFICVINDDKIDIICKDIINEFDAVIGSYYDEKDRKKGYIMSENRKGEKEKFSVMTISIGVVTTRRRYFSHIGEISKLGSELKNFAKKHGESSYIVDRREG